jgi:hypothetical protein
LKSVTAKKLGLITDYFNNDNISDVAVVNYWNNSISILLGYADGILKLNQSYTVGVSPYSVTSDDFNNDTIVDLAVVNSGDDCVSLLFGDINRIFTAPNKVWNWSAACLCFIESFQ